MRYITILLIISAGLIVNSCELLFDCLEGNGNSTEQERAVSSFTSVRSTSSIDVVIEYNDESYITVTADENLQQYINAYVEDGELIIETETGRCLQSENQILVTVYCPYVETVVLSGSGDLDVFDFSVDYFNIKNTGSGDIDINNLLVVNSIEVNLSGSGDITIDGKAKDAKFFLSGSGNIQADMLKVNSNNIVLSGSGDIYSFVYEYLKIVLSGSGNLYYYGNTAEVDQRITGSGDIYKR